MNKEQDILEELMLRINIGKRLNENHAMWYKVDFPYSLQEIISQLTYITPSIRNLIQKVMRFEDGTSFGVFPERMFENFQVMSIPSTDSGDITIKEPEFLIGQYKKLPVMDIIDINTIRNINKKDYLDRQSLYLLKIEVVSDVKEIEFLLYVPDKYLN